MAAESIPQRILAPLRTARLWVTLTWSLTLAVGAAGWEWAEGRFAEAAQGVTMVLLPATSLDGAGREAILGKLQGEPGVMAAQWLAPAEMTRRVSERFPQTQWQDLFPSDEAWLGWMMEVRPVAPLDQIWLMNDFAARRQKEGTWRLVLWDSAPLVALAEQRGALRATLGFFLALAGLGGCAALACIPLAREGRVGSIVWSALLGALGPVAVWSAAVWGGVDPEWESLWLGLAAGSILAGAVAPFIRRRGDRHLSLTIGEDTHERIW